MVLINLFAGRKKFVEALDTSNQQREVDDIHGYTHHTYVLQDIEENVGQPH